MPSAVPERRTARAVAGRGFGLSVAAMLLSACGSLSGSPSDESVSSAGASSEAPESTDPSAVSDVSVDGVPVVCGDNIVIAECESRAESALRDSLPRSHPPVVRIVVTCDADLCDADEGSGQVIVHFQDGTREVIDVGFGHL